MQSCECAGERGWKRRLTLAHAPLLPAPFQVPLGPWVGVEISTAVGAVEAASAVGASMRSRALAVRACDAALRAAERDMFDRLMRGPVYHFVQRRARFKAWAEETRDVLFTSVENHRML